MSAKSMIFAVAIGVSAALCASSLAALAQNTAGRDAAISKCVKWAHEQHPNEDGMNQQGRSDAYKACMTQAGFQP